MRPVWESNLRSTARASVAELYGTALRRGLRTASCLRTRERLSAILLVRGTVGNAPSGRRLPEQGRLWRPSVRVLLPRTVGDGVWSNAKRGPAPGSRFARGPPPTRLSANPWKSRGDPAGSVPAFSLPLSPRRSRMTPMVARTSLAGSLFALLALGCTESEQTPEVNATGVGRIVYAVRQHTAIDGSGAPRIDVAGGMGQVMDYGRYVPGGRLEILDLASGDVKSVSAAYPLADVSSVDVSFDAKKVLFTMKRDPNDDYHVYWAPLEPSADGTFEVTQLTFGPYDDQNAIFAAGGRI